jgi:metal-responsive CopG/Arc/MetJ family transcriptional regulator
MPKTFNISLPEPLVAAIDRRAKEENRSRSEVLRAAALSYLDWWRDWRELHRYGRAQAKKLGIKPKDIERLIAEVRTGQQAKH